MQYCLLRFVVTFVRERWVGFGGGAGWGCGLWYLGMYSTARRGLWPHTHRLCADAAAPAVQHDAPVRIMDLSDYNIYTFRFRIGSSVQAWRHAMGMAHGGRASQLFENGSDRKELSSFQEKIS